MAAAPSPPKPGRARAGARLILSPSDYPEHPEISNNPSLGPPPAGGGGGGRGSSLSSLSTPSPPSLSREMTTTPGAEARVRHGRPHPSKADSGRRGRILESLWTSEG